MDRPSLPGRKPISPDLIASLVLVGIGILFFYDFFFTSKNLYFRDILNFHYPLRKLLIDSYTRGELPLWNPFIYMGQPMLANPNYMAFYPTNLFHLFLPFNYAFKLHFIIHPMLGGLGMHFLARRLGIGCLASFVGALAYQLSGTVLSFLNLYNLVPAVALLPWIGWAFYGALQRRSIKRNLLFGALLALQIIACEPLLSQCVVWLLIGLAVFFLTEAKERIAAAKILLRVGLVGGVFAFGLAAAQVIPTLELLPLTSRHQLPFDQVAIWSAHPLDLLSTLIPNLFGNYYAIGFNLSWGESIHDGREGYLVSLFMGTFILMLATLSIASRQKRLRGILIVLAGIGIYLALGKNNPAYHWLYDHIPLFAQGRYPSKYFLLSTLTICLSAALGAEVLLNRWESSSKKIRRIGFSALALGCLFLIFWLYTGHVPQLLESWLRFEIGHNNINNKNLAAIIEQLRHSLLSSGVFLFLGSIIVLLSSRLKHPFLLSATLPVLIAAELIPANLRLSPLISKADFEFVPEVNQFIKGLPLQEPYRVVPPTILKPRDSYRDLMLRAPNRSLAWMTLFYKMSAQPFHGIINSISYSIYGTVDFLNTRETDILRSVCAKLPEQGKLALFQKLNSPVVLSFEELRDFRLHFLSKFSNGSQYPVHVYWLDNTVKRAYFASGYDYVPNQEAALERFLDPSFPIGTAVILEGSGDRKSAISNAGTASIVEHNSSRVICDVDARYPGHLVLMDSYYPGWIAYVDGKKTEIQRANYAFRSVPVTAGRHRVEFIYRPLSFYIGLVISCATLLVGIAAMIFWGGKSENRSEIKATGDGLV